ncbi:hypothetical protein [Dactylosporangium sp. NPDC005555]|uniref:hypothetical protein n=1 Tax=Dactylosporangium sp. NPDC005555 TaxID=3154889 RepID=UPI0033BEBD6A
MAFQAAMQSRMDRIIIPIAVVIATFATRDVQDMPGLMRTPAIRALGEISFGFCLCQGVTVIHDGGTTRDAPLELQPQTVPASVPPAAEVSAR